MTMPSFHRRLVSVLAAAAALSACGGGGSDGTAPSNLSANAQAATSTAQNNAACVRIKPFYWEVGDKTAALVSGAVGDNTYGANTQLAIASASKWLYSSYFVQKTGGVLTTSDIRFFNFQSGYTNFTSCAGSSTVGGCVSQGSNGVKDAATEGHFDYGGGHMQVHAANNGLAALDNAALANEVRAKLGTDVALAYGQPQLAGGANTSAAAYAVFLRKILAGQLVMGSVLGTHAVCTNTDIPGVCPAAIATPSPPGERWSYSIGHWVEDTSNVSDGAFSSAGAFGFYPWIDKTRTYYGVIARSDGAGGGVDSVYCGRLIRKAWVTAAAQ